MKKTPREILIERHRYAEPRLDAIRSNIVSRAAASARAETKTCEQGTPNHFFASIWRELFCRCAGRWAALAAAWALIFTLNQWSGDGAPKTHAASLSATRAAQTLFLDRQQLLAEMAEATPGTQRPVAVPASSRPRSDGISNFTRTA